MALSTRATAQPPAPAAINLVCSGKGEKLTTEMRPVRRRDAKHDSRRMKPESVTIHFDAEVSVEIAEGGGRIRLPDRMISPLNGNQGSPWWELRELVVNEDEITGRYRMNAIETYRLRIDRATGRISIIGSPSFHGACERYDPGRRRF
jgi:hypothetical protein